MDNVIWETRNPLHAWRKERGLSVWDIQSILRVRAQSIYQWERGQYKPSPYNMLMLAHHLGSDIEARWDAWLKDRPNNGATEG